MKPGVMMASHEGTKTRRIETRRLRFLFDTKSGATPSSGVEEYWDGDINWVTPEDLGKLESRYIQDTRRSITEEGYKNCGVSLVPADSLILSKRAPIGLVAILSVDATCNQGCFLLTKQNDVDERFYYYALLYLRPLLEILGRGSTFMELSADDLRSVRLPYPDVETQRLIAGYLDRETARIDALVAEKEQMLALLEEKRAALISRAVTRGLDPTAPLKPSGLDWLGDIPAHWDLIRLGYLVTLQGGSTPTTSKDKYWRGSIPWASPKDIKQPVLSDTIDHVSEIALIETGLSLIDPPVLLLVVRGMILAKTIPTSLTSVPMTVNQDMKALRPRDKHVLPDYLKLVFDGLQKPLSTLIEESAHGTRCLRTDLLTNFKIPLPQADEQKLILKKIRIENTELDVIGRALKGSIELLKERRAALITAAVTGQIPVEEMRP